MLSTLNSWLFPPETREVQMDEKWNFVKKTEKVCDPNDPDDQFCGDNWDHTGVDAENRLVLALVPGKRTGENCKKLVGEVHKRTGGRTDILLTTDDHASYKTGIEEVYGRKEAQPKRLGPGRPPKPQRVRPREWCYGTVNKIRKKGVVVEVFRTLIFGTLGILDLYLSRSKVSRKLNTSFVARNNGTDRHQNGRKARKTYAFSKSWEWHNLRSCFVAYSYNFCGPVRTHRFWAADGRWQDRTPAMAAHLTDHVWNTEEWVTFPAKPG